MIGTIDIKANAAHPNMPLCPIYAHVGSPSQVRIINVPKAIGKWAVTSVQITANYPDNSSRSVTATLVGGCWSATLPASTAVGQSLMGFKVTVSGTDESGAAVTGYVLGKGDVFILNDDSTITIGETTYYVHLLDAQPTTPKKGDLCLIGGAWKIYNGTEWIAFGGGTGDVRHAEFSDMTADLDPDESSMGDVMTKVNTLISKLKGTTAALVALLALGSFAAVEVQTAALKTLPGKTMVVTNIVGAAAVSDLALKQDALSLAGTNAVTSGITATKVATYDGYATNKADKEDIVTATNTMEAAGTDSQIVRGCLSEYTGKWSINVLLAECSEVADEAHILTDDDNCEIIFQNGRLEAWYIQEGVKYDEVAYMSDVGAVATNAYTKTQADGRFVQQSTVGSTTYTSAAQILSSAENTAGTIASNLVDHTNVRFSNEVLAVGLGIGTNEVAQINAILTDMGETPIGEATTIGALLAALAAAVAWIKKKSVKKDSNGYYFED